MLQIRELLSIFEHEAKVLVTSMLPIVEIKGAIPVGLAYGMNIYHAALLAYIGSMLPAPLILLGGRRATEALSKSRILGKPLKGLLARAEGKYERSYQKYGTWALLAFVAVPLPGTGVWTGSLIASMLRLNLKWATIAIIVGNAVATALMAVSAYGVQRVWE